MKRTILQDLTQWQKKADRKPLILKGVRQTGKTFSLKEFGRLNFSRMHYINFEHQPLAAQLFEHDFNPKRILSDLSFLLNNPINVQEDLVIFDEIQACPAALTSLKYFAEQLPELALCCAGSLLGLHLGETAFPVGKVDLLLMRPMSFAEYLTAVDDQKSLTYLAGDKAYTSEIIHQHLWQQFKIYLVTGGMPEVVKTYIENQEDVYQALTKVRQKQNELIIGYYADIAKHSGKINAMHIDRVWRAIPLQLAQSQDGNAQRFYFKDIIPGIDRYQRLASVLDWLLAAELIIKVPIVEHVELPLMAYTKESYFKLYMFDVGILGAMIELSPKVILDYDYGTYKGYFAENFVAQEFVAQGIKHLYSWQQNRAEVEFLYVMDNQIIPIEIKSGWVTRNQSLNTYAKKYQPPYRAVFSAKPLNIDLTNRYHQYPVYMAGWFPK